MKISKPIKILIGAITATVALYPFLIGPAFVALFMFMGPGFPFYDPRMTTSPEYMTRFMPTFLLIFLPIMMCSTLLQLALQVFYLALVIKDKHLTDVTRILFALAMFFMPFVGMPLYFIAYFWGDSPQESNTQPATTTATQ